MKNELKWKDKKSFSLGHEIDGAGKHFNKFISKIQTNDNSTYLQVNDELKKSTGISLLETIIHAKRYDLAEVFRSICINVQLKKLTYNSFISEITVNWSFLDM